MKTQAFSMTALVAGRATAVFGAASFAVAIAAFSAGGMRTASAQRVECTGPLRQCAIDVGGWCEREPGGKIVMIYYDRSSNVMQYEKCVGAVFEKMGKPNPYKPAPEKPASTR